VKSTPMKMKTKLTTLLGFGLLFSALLAHATPPSGESAAPASTQPVAAAGEPFVDVESFKLKAKVSAETFTQAMRRMEALPKDPALLSRHYFINDKGEVLLINIWRSEADFNRADETEPSAEEAAAEDALIELVSKLSYSSKTYRAPLVTPSSHGK
jgi:hypothetical protein